MQRKNKMILYSVLLALGLGVFISELFIFQKPDGVLGFMICLVSVYVILASIIKLCVLSKSFSHRFLDVLELLFWLP